MKFVPIAGFIVSLMMSIAHAETIWIEGEKPAKSTMNRHPWWYDQVKKDQLSGGDWISNFAEKKPAGEAEYSVTAKDGGKFEFWVRANPTATKLSFRLNDADWKPIEFEKNARDAANIAGDGKLDLRFIAWAKVGSVELKRGANTIRFRMHSDNSNHGGLDCFVLSTEPFTPRGILKPGETPKASPSFDKDWFAFDPSADKFGSSSAIDLRFLNEKVAGEQGFIAAKDGHFVHSQTDEPVRFWAVNGAAAKSRDELKREARQLAKYGVNLVRLHGPMFDKRGEVDPAKIQRAFGCRNEGEFSEWSMRDGHSWVDRSALRFESEEPGKPASFVHPAMDPKYDNKPSMISETTWNRPNRHRSEAPLYLAAFGALQDSDCIVHFAKDGVDWSVKPGYFMQPWTLTAPTQLGQFPAAALIYRRGLVKTGDVMADVTLDVEDLLKLGGTPLPQDAAFDELRLKDVSQGTTLKPGQRTDPLVHYVGRT